MGVEAHRIRYGHGFRDGLLGRVVELHALYYSPTWGLGLPMELSMAKGLAELAERYDADRDRIGWAELDGRVVGSLTLDGQDHAGRGAKLRWFILETGLHGHGIGGRLIDQALAFARDRGYRRIYLHTFEGLAAAIRLYRRAGFEQTGVERRPLWGTQIDVLEMSLDLDTEDSAESSDGAGVRPAAGS